MSYFSGRYFAPHYLAVRYFPGGASITFPTQYAGLRFFHGTTQELCLVDVADAPPGAQPRIEKNGVTYTIYLVDVTDPEASTIRMNTPDGVKAIRKRT